MPFHFIRSTTVTVANGAALSGASGDLKDLGQLVAVLTDSAWDTNAITFQGSIDGTNFFDIYEEGSEYSVTGAAASKAYTVDVQVFMPYSYIKVRSGTGASPANQSGDSVVTLVLWQVSG